LITPTGGWRSDITQSICPIAPFDKRPQVNQAAIVENKRLGPILAYIAEQQKKLDMSRSAKAPRRRGQKNHMFKVGWMGTRAPRCAIWKLHATPSRYNGIQPSKGKDG